MARNYRTGTMQEVRPGVWRLRVHVKDPVTGKPRQLSRTFDAGKRRGTKQAAAEALRAFKDEAEALTVTGPNATVASLLDDWLADLERLGRAAGTLASYRTHVAQHIRPGLGSVRLDQLGSREIARYFGDLKAKGLSAGTVKLDKSILCAALNQGVEWKYLPANPAKNVRIEKAESTGAAVTTDQLVQLLTAAELEDVDASAAIMVAALTGCRLGEVCGLKWSDLDAERCTLRVERQIGPDGRVIPRTKTGKVVTVNIGAAGVELLNGYRAAKASQIGREPDGWLVSLNGGATPMSSKSLSAYFSSLAGRLGIRATFHSIRRWKDTEMHARGVDMATMAAQSGHTAEVMARSYFRTNDDRGAAAGELIAGVVVKAIAEHHDGAG